MRMKALNMKSLMMSQMKCLSLSLVHQIACSAAL